MAKKPEAGAVPNPPTGGAVFGGLTLEQYAGVSTALAEGFALPEILDQEDIETFVWPTASRAWVEAIADSIELQMALVQKRRIAEDCLGSPIAPLDDDPAAWSGLLGAMATSDAPQAILEGLGIQMGDVGRLGRAWKRKMEADPELAKRMVEVAPTAKPPAKIQVGPRKLKPFPWTPTVKAPAAPEPTDALAAPPAQSTLAAAQLAAEPRPQLASFQLPGQSSGPTPAFAPSYMRHASPAPSAPAPSAPARAPPAPAPAPPAPAPPAPARAAAPQIDATAEMDIPREFKLPFVAGPSKSKGDKGPTPAATPPPPLPAARASPGSEPKFHTGTALASEAGSSGDLPFAAPPLPSGVPTLTIDQYAWVMATLKRASPADLPAVYLRLRLTAESRKQLEAHWQARMRADPKLQQSFISAFARHVASGG